MNTNVQKPNAAALAIYQTLRAGVAQTRASMPVMSGGTPYLRLLRDGKWAMGAEDSEIVDGTEAIINPLSIQHGYSCWTDRGPKEGKNEKLGEEMWKITQPKPMANTLQEMTDPRTHAPCKWKDQMSFELKLLDGKYKDEQTLYSATSVGGLRLVDTLMKALENQLDTGSMYIFPIVRIGSDSYQHSSYGKTYTPVMEIVGWADMNGNEEGIDADEAPAPEPEVEAPAPAVEEQVTTSQIPPAGRRRRV
jgi:hypothetical protein